VHRINLFSTQKPIKSLTHLGIDEWLGNFPFRVWVNVCQMKPLNLFFPPAADGKMSRREVELQEKICAAAVGTTAKQIN